MKMLIALYVVTALAILLVSYLYRKIGSESRFLRFSEVFASAILALCAGVFVADYGRDSFELATRTLGLQGAQLVVGFLILLLGVSAYLLKTWHEGLYGTMELVFA